MPVIHDGLSTHVENSSRVEFPFNSPLQLYVYNQDKNTVVKYEKYSLRIHMNSKDVITNPSHTLWGFAKHNLRLGMDE